MNGYQDTQVWNLSCYFIECLLLGEQFLAYPSSKQAAGALFLAIKVIYDGNWSQQLIDRIGFTEMDLLDLVYGLLEFLQTPLIQTVYDKYSTSKYQHVSVNMRTFLAQKC
jgi:hypothetical protein